MTTTARYIIRTDHSRQLKSNLRCRNISSKLTILLFFFSLWLLHSSLLPRNCPMTRSILGQCSTREICALLTRRFCTLLCAIKRSFRFISTINRKLWPSRHIYSTNYSSRLGLSSLTQKKNVLLVQLKFQGGSIPVIFAEKFRSCCQFLIKNVTGLNFKWVSQKDFFLLG